MSDLPAAWRFTPPDGGARLAAACGQANTLATLSPQHAAFTAVKLVHESARDIRRPLSEGGKRSVIIARPCRLQNLSGEVTRLTDLSVLLATSYSDVKQWPKAVEEKQVLLVTSEVLRQIMDDDLLHMKDLNVLVIDGCHIISKDEHLQVIMKSYYTWRSQASSPSNLPRILALTFPLFVQDSMEADVSAPEFDDTKGPSSEDNADDDGIDETPIVEEISSADCAVAAERGKSERSLINILDSRFDLPRPKCKIIEIHDEDIKNDEQIINGDELTNKSNINRDNINKCDESNEIMNKFTKVIDETNDNIDNCVHSKLAIDEECLVDLNQKLIKISLKSKHTIDVNVPLVTIEKEINFESNVNGNTSESRLGIWLDSNEGESVAPEPSSDAPSNHPIVSESVDDPIPMYEKLECQLESLENMLHCSADLAEDVDGSKRLGEKPRELIIECEEQVHGNLPDDYKQLETDIRQSVLSVRQFLCDHRFDLSEIYGDQEEFKSIPNPATDPIAVLDQFLDCLTCLGPYAADKAAICILSKLDKLKVKIPYERHFLLLELCTTLFAKIRKMADDVFEDVEPDREKFSTYCTPKLNRLLELLMQFAPAKGADGARRAPRRGVERAASDRTNDGNKPQKDPGSITTKNLLENIDECDFKSLGMKIEGKFKKSLRNNELSASGVKEKNLEKYIPLNLNNSKTLVTEKYVRKRPHIDFKGRGRARDRANANYNALNPDALCGVIFVQKPLMAKVLFMLISEYSHWNADLSFVCAQYSAIEKPADPLSEPKEAEHQRKVQEEVLKRFRIHECNLLLATPTLEEGIDLPKCNLMLRWDAPNGYRSYTRCRARARAPRSIAAMLADGSSRESGTPCAAPSDHLLRRLATYAQLDTMIQRKCGSGSKDDPCIEDEVYADRFTRLIETYSPDVASNVEDTEKILKSEPASYNPNDVLNMDTVPTSPAPRASVNLTNAISLINRYCAKLPSDTFTRLVPHSTVESVRLNGVQLYISTLRLPINCPVKYNIVGHPMPTKVLARRMAALQASRILHLSGELDNQLMPIGKENFTAVDAEWEVLLQLPHLPPETPILMTPSAHHGGGHGFEVPRPGTTKRRQYYFKRTARALCDCRPLVDCGNVLLYTLDARLQCPLPERHNTRGRRLHAPELAASSLAILTSKPIDKIPGFPIYTRSGEVGIQIRLVGRSTNDSTDCGTTVAVRDGVQLDARLTAHRVSLIHSFMRYLFGDVLRVRRAGMPLDVRGIRRAGDYYIVPTINENGPDGTAVTTIDWDFLERIHSIWRACRASNNEPIPGTEAEPKILTNPNVAEGATFVFNAEIYKDAVVTPWYRNHDQPQYFYVAEICQQLSPLSAFPQPLHESFAAYYMSKYSVSVTQLEQPLLDVDHTSARLNLLTPRYVSRKGVALPVSSERTRRAKRDRLDQKQILVPELCSVHPFSGALWRCAVALPCILYRINALLLADEIRRSVALEIGVGRTDLSEGNDPSFEWPPLDFGWSLADILKDDSKDKADAMEVDKIVDDELEQTLEDVVLALESSKEDSESVAETAETTTDLELLPDREEQDGDAFEIGMWSNEIAEQAEKAAKVKQKFLETLPPNLTLCTTDVSDIGGWGDPIESPPLSYTRNKADSNRKYMMADSDISYLSSDLDSFDSDMDSDTDSDCGVEIESGITQGAPSCGVRIEFKNPHEAEAIDIESKETPSDERPDCKTLARDFALAEQREHDDTMKDFIEYFYGKVDEARENTMREHIEKFSEAVLKNEERIRTNGTLVDAKQSLGDVLQRFKATEASPTSPEYVSTPETETPTDALKLYEELFRERVPDLSDLRKVVAEKGIAALEDLEENASLILEKIKQDLPPEEWRDLNCFSMTTKAVPLKSPQLEVGCLDSDAGRSGFGSLSGGTFDFDYQPDLQGHPGPSPSALLQALTMSNANDGINLERLETIGDSFLKYAITAYLYCVRPHVHEGKLSHMRSKQVSNLNLYRLGRGKRLGGVMIATKFEPHDNWLPPSHRAPKRAYPHHQQQFYENYSRHQNGDDSTDPNWTKIYEDYSESCPLHGVDTIVQKNGPKTPPNPFPAIAECSCKNDDLSPEAPSEAETSNPYFVPYNLITQHSIPDKSVADCVEALIGAYLIECGPRGALLFMSWLGIKVLPKCELPLRQDHPYVQRFGIKGCSAEPRFSSNRRHSVPAVDDDDDSNSDFEEWSESERNEGLEEEAFEEDWSWHGRTPGSLKPYTDDEGNWFQTVYGALVAPPSPLLRHIRDPDGELEKMLSGYEKLECTLKYRFRDRALMLQAMTHASHSHNRLTDCYQRLEFLGDAVLDYLITRYLYEDKRRHSPGALTDLRSALVNNTIFASLAVRHGFHKYFRHMSPGLNEVLSRFVRIQEENGHSISEEHYLIQEDELEQAEDVEVPKALGDLFESIAGAIYLDSGLSLSAVWSVYHGLMAPELDAFSASVPKSPVRELLEAEPETAKFGKPERLADGRRVRVTVEVFGRGTFKGVGRNYRIAKCTAARCALRHLAKANGHEAKVRQR